MDPRVEYARLMTRRHFFGRASAGIGVAALAQLLGVRALSADAGDTGGLAGLPHFAPKAKRVIYLFQSGRTLAARAVRLQAAAREVRRATSCRIRSGRDSG